MSAHVYPDDTIKYSVAGYEQVEVDRDPELPIPDEGKSKQLWLGTSLILFNRSPADKCG